MEGYNEIYPQLFFFSFFLLLMASHIRDNVDKLHRKCGLAHYVTKKEGQWSLMEFILPRTYLILEPSTGRRRGKAYMSSKILYTASDIRILQQSPITLGGYVHKNPGPTRKKTPKNPCKECGKNVRSNQAALSCAQCNIKSHAKYLNLNLSKTDFKFYTDCPENDWTCSLCSLPFSIEECLIDCIIEEYGSVFKDNGENQSDYANHDTGENANEDLPDSRIRSIVVERSENSSGAFIVHLNINSIQNKFEELKLLNSSLRSHVIVISETKIDSSYPNSQFNLPGYHMYRKDRKKGGGGLLIYFSSTLPSKKKGPAKDLQTLEAIAVEAKIGKNDILFLSIYRPPKTKQEGR